MKLYFEEFVKLLYKNDSNKKDNDKYKYYPMMMCS